MRKIAQYFYGDNVTLVLYAEGRLMRVRDPNSTYGHDGLPKPPVCPINNTRTPHPCEDETDPGIPSYDELGLYYGYDMPDTGWSGDC